MVTMGELQGQQPQSSNGGVQQFDAEGYSIKFQKEMKKRLMAVLKHKDNKTCVDCAERRPTWGAMMIPPPFLTLLVGTGGAEEEVVGNKILCAFACFQCAGSHRQLGSRLSYVKSVTQEECKYFAFFCAMVSLAFG
jgi:hypothetical protein